MNRILAIWLRAGEVHWGKEEETQHFDELRWKMSKTIFILLYFAATEAEVAASIRC